MVATGAGAAAGGVIATGAAVTAGTTVATGAAGASRVLVSGTELAIFSTGAVSVGLLFNVSIFISFWL